MGPEIDKARHVFQEHLRHALEALRRLQRTSADPQAANFQPLRHEQRPVNRQQRSLFVAKVPTGRKVHKGRGYQRQLFQRCALSRHHGHIGQPPRQARRAVDE